MYVFLRFICFGPISANGSVPFYRWPALGASSQMSRGYTEDGFRRTYSELPLKLQHACKVCVISAIQSTEAFDGIKGRLVVTNIFGTAHAYDSKPDLLKLTG